MVNNFEQIRGMLDFRSRDHFYLLQILQRKKDHKIGKVNGTNNNSRLIKAYQVRSLEYFDFIKPEIIELCKLFNARAGFNLNRRSYEKMSLQLLRKVADQIMNKSFDKAHAAYNTVCGAYNHESDKSWIIDLDAIDIERNPNIETELTDFIYDIEPKGSKIIAKIPSKTGFHLISKPFNLSTFKTSFKFKESEIHKNNPTNLFIP